MYPGPIQANVRGGNLYPASIQANARGGYLYPEQNTTDMCCVQGLNLEKSCLH